MTPEWLFPLFGIFTVAMAAAVVLARNPVYSAFGLILSFFGLAGIYLLWGSTFLSVVQILIYAGAIVVLFVFVVMLLNLGKLPTTHFSWVLVTVSGLAVWLLAFLVLKTLTQESLPVTSQMVDFNIRHVSKLLFSKYLWPFEVLSVFLLVMVVAIFSVARHDSGEAV